LEIIGGIIISEFPWQTSERYSKVISFGKELLVVSYSAKNRVIS